MTTPATFPVLPQTKKPRRISGLGWLFLAATVLMVIFGLLFGLYVLRNLPANGLTGPGGAQGVGTVGPSGPPGIGVQGAGGAGGGAGANGKDAVGTNGANGLNGTGTNGRDGLNGKDGQGVSVTAVPAGDPNCPNGGVRMVSESGVNYVCNGGPGPPGPSGPPGPTPTPVVP